MAVFDDLNDFNPQDQDILKKLSQNGAMLSFEEVQTGVRGIDFPDFPPVENNIFKEEWKLRTMQEIQEYFFPDSNIVKKHGITINDNTGVFQDSTIAREILLEEVIIESFSGVKKSYIELDDIDIVVFTSKDGAQLLRAWRNAKESVHKNPRTLALFMETDDNFNVFGSVMDFVVGVEVEKHFKSDYWKKVVEYVKENELTISSKDIKKLVNKSISKRSVFQFFSEIYQTTKSKIKDVSLEVVESAFKGLSEGIEKWKFTEDQWNSNSPDFEYDKMPFVTAFAVGMPYKTIEKSGAKATDIVNRIYNGIKQLIDKVADMLPKRIRQKLKQFIEALNKQIKSFYRVIKDNTENLIKIYLESAVLLNAFLCGFINGLIDLVKSIFDIVVLLIGLARLQNDYDANKGYYTDLTYEYLENYLEAYIKFDFIAFANKMMILHTANLVKIINFVKSLDLTNINFSAVAYYTGYVIFGIVEIIIGILFTGGSATITKLFKTGGDVMNKSVKAAMSVADDLLGMLRYLMRLFEKGVDEVVAFFKKITDDFFDWLEDMFRKGKSLDWLSSGIFKFGNDNVTYRNFVRLKQRKDDGWHNVLCHGSSTRVVIDGRKYKAEEFAKMLLEQGYEKGNPIRLISCETGSKTNGFASQLAKLLETKVIAPTERIAIDDLGRFIHDKKGKFVEFNK